MQFIHLALPTPLNQTFTYLPLANQPLPLVGTRVKAPFGSRQLVGVVLAVNSSCQLPANKLKRCLVYLDETPLFSSQDIKFLTWVSRYYHQPLGEVLSLAMPALLRQGQSLHPPQAVRWQLTATGKQAQAISLGRAYKQAELLKFLQQEQQAFTQTKLQTAGFSLALIKGLAEKSLIEEVKFTRPTAGIGLPKLNLAEAPTHLLTQPELVLSDEQALALTSLSQGLNEFKVSLLEGVTGSGKTEVYLQLMHLVLQAGKQVLVLVPEIGLTPQTLARFSARFNVKLVALHSGLTPSQRLSAWRQGVEGQAKIILGTRSAILAPLPNLGLILVDEEHDASYKQQDTLRYQARDLAVFKAKQLNIPLVLGSATPSLESLKKASEGSYTWLKLSQRPLNNSQPPEPKLLDIRSEKLNAGLSQPLIVAMQKHLKAGNQVLILLNRRGYAPVLMCSACGWLADCQLCDAKLTYHQEPLQLLCHHCNHQQPLPNHCPSCQSLEVFPLGVGTERLEEALAEIFPSLPLIRLDRDTLRRPADLAAALKNITQQSPAIILGTQMLAKGHHFPQVSLATVLNADQGLYSSDPKALERSAQLIIQVAGRAGRAEKPGEVLIQTHHSDDPRLIKLCKEGYSSLAKDLLAERQESHWPPFAFIALFRAEAYQKEQAEELMQLLSQQAQLINSQLELNVNVLGPTPAPMERRQGRYQMQLLLHAEKRSSLHQLASNLLAWLHNQSLARRVRWSLDIDPEDLF